MSFYSGVYLVRFRIQYFIHSYRGEVGFIQYSKQLTSLIVAQPRYVLKVRPITGISHQVISPGSFLSSSPSFPLGKKRLGRQKFHVLIILARISSFVTEKISWDQKKGAVLTDNEEARQAANIAIAKPISRNFSCAR